MVSITSNDWVICAMELSFLRSRSMLPKMSHKGGRFTAYLEHDGGGPGSHRVSKIASRWLKSLVESHPSCVDSPEVKKPPRRLLHIGNTSNTSQKPFLVDTFPDLRHLDWVALSYCWGDDPSMKLTEDTMIR